MDVQIAPSGVVNPTQTEDGKERLLFEVPIVFRRISTGPDGIHEALVSHCSLGPTQLRVTRQTSFYSTENRVEGGKRRLAGQPIEQRPVMFRPDPNNDNQIVLAFETERPIRDNTATREALEVVLDITFSNLVGLELAIDGEVLPTGAIRLRRIRRKTSPILTDLNLTALVLLAGSLVGWNSYLNTDVYLQSSAVSDKIVAAVTGSVLTFVGLSFARIRTWIATLTETLAVLRFPELHLNLSLFRSLSSKAWTAVLALVMGACGWVVYQNWSVSLPKVTDIAIYDTTEGQYVANRRAYRRDLESGRLIAVCSHPEQDMTRRNPFKLGTLDEQGRIQDVGIRISHHEGLTKKELSGGNEEPAVAWVGRRISPPELEEDILDVLCGPEPSDDLRLPSGRIARVETLSNPTHRRLTLSDRRLWEYEAVDNWVDDLRGSLKKLDLDVLFADRRRYLADLERSLSDMIGDNGVVELTAVYEKTLGTLGEIGGEHPQEKALERGLVLRALWRIAGEGRRDRRPDPDEIALIAGSLQQLLSSEYGYKVDRILLELLLEIQKQNSFAAGNHLHRAAESSWANLKNDEKFPRVADYLAAVAMVDAFGEPQRRFLKALVGPFQQWAGPEEDLASFIVNRDKTERADWKADYSVVASRLAAVFAIAQRT